jgi:hypothetical protein
MAGGIMHTEMAVCHLYSLWLLEAYDGTLEYLLPNDEHEADQLDMVHEMTLTVMHRKLHFAPVDPSIQRALDLGTGTGIVSLTIHK